MASISVFKLKFTNSNGVEVESKNYYFYHNRKKVNTGLTNKRDAASFVDKYLQDLNTEKASKQDSKIQDKPDGKSLLSKLKKEGWISFDANGKCIYSDNPKYKKAQDTEGMSYGVQQAKMVGSVLRRTFVEKADVLGEKPYNKITKTDAHSFRDRLAKYDFPNSTKNETMKALRAIYTFWNYDETIVFNPFKKTATFQDFPRTTEDKRDVFSTSELQTIFNKELMIKLYPEDNEWLEFLESDYFTSFAFAALTGLRSAEVRCLIKSQISDERILTVDRAFKAKNTRKDSIGLPKCGKTRVIVLCDSAFEIITDRLYDSNVNNADYIFLNKTGNNAMEASRWNKQFNYFMKKVQEKYSKILGNRYFTPHCLRKTLNTLLVNKYMISPDLVIDYLGWGESITRSALTKVQKEHYTITKAEHMLIVAQAIERMYSGREMLWSLLDNGSDNDTDLELKKMNMMILGGLDV